MLTTPIGPVSFDAERKWVEDLESKGSFKFEVHAESIAAKTAAIASVSVSRPANLCWTGMACLVETSVIMLLSAALVTAPWVSV